MADFEILMDAHHHVGGVPLGVFLVHVSVQVVPETLLMELFHSHRGGIFDLHVDEVQKLQGQQLWDTDNKIRFFYILPRKLRIVQAPYFPLS